MLFFKKKFLDAIRAGAKTQTVRFWKQRMFRAGQRSYIPGVGYIRVESVEPIALADLTETDARLDGFASLADLLAEIARIYPTGTSDGKQLFRLRFSVFSPEEQRAMRLATKEKKAGMANAAAAKDSAATEHSTNAANQAAPSESAPGGGAPLLSPASEVGPPRGD